MNAPIQAAANVPQYQILPIASLVPSDTHIQSMRRKRFDPKAMQELADSIGRLGVMQPIVVRPWKDGKFQIIAGERRWTATKLAKLDTIPTTVSTITDDGALEIQLMENLQREGLHELEEAEGYAELMKLKKLTADALVDLIAKSRTYVYQRLKLLKLCKEAREAFYAGEMSASIAYLVARIEHHDLQRQYLKEINATEWDRDGPMSYREALEHQHENYHLQLKSAPFDVKAVYTGAGGKAIGVPCGGCPKRSGNERDLFADIKGADVCTDPKCFAEKRAGADAIRLKEAEDKGLKVITGAAAKKVRPHQYDTDLHGYVTAKQKDYDFGGKTYQELLGKDLPQPALLVDPHSQTTIEVYPEEEIREALKKRGYKATHSSGGSSYNSQGRADDRKAKIEARARMRIFNAVREGNAKRALDINDTRRVTAWMWSYAGFDQRKRIVDARNLAAGLPKPKGHEYVSQFGELIEGMDARDLAVLMLDIILASELAVHTYSTGKPDHLHAAADRVGVDYAAIRKAVQTEAAAKAKPKKPRTNPSSTHPPFSGAHHERTPTNSSRPTRCRVRKRLLRRPGPRRRQAAQLLPAAQGHRPPRRNRLERQQRARRRRAQLQRQRGQHAGDGQGRQQARPVGAGPRHGHPRHRRAGAALSHLQALWRRQQPVGALRHQSQRRAPHLALRAAGSGTDGHRGLPRRWCRGLRPGWLLVEHAVGRLQLLGLVPGLRLRPPELRQQVLRAGRARRPHDPRSHLAIQPFIHSPEAHHAPQQQPHRRPKRSRPPRSHQPPCR
jgi:ParB/RepB/Spo0J family partition protein